MDIAAARKRCEAAIPEPWTLRRVGDPAPNVDVMSGETVIATMGDFFPEAEFVAHARSDLPVALKLLEHQEPMVNQYKKIIEWLAKYVHSGESTADLLVRLTAALEALKEAQGKLEAVRRGAEDYAGQAGRDPLFDAGMITAGEGILFILGESG